MSVTAVCPQCSNSATVPDEAVGKKVRCKKCSGTFVVEAAPAKAAAKSGARPKTKAPTRRGTQPATDGKKKPQKSNAMLWVVLSVVVLAVAGGGVAAWFVLQQPTAPVHTKKKKDKEEKGSPIAEKSEKRGKTEAKNESVASQARNDPGGRAKAESKSAPEFKSTEAATVAPLFKSASVELPDISAIRQVFPVPARPTRVGIHSLEKGENYFEMYDLEKQERLAKFKLPKNLLTMDVDPDGTMLAVADTDIHFNLYEIPSGAPAFDDDWRPYKDIKAEDRFLGDDGKLALFRLVGKDQLLVLTSKNSGDLWDWHKPTGPIVLYPAVSHDEFKNQIISPRDAVLSTDCSMLAFVTDDGIALHESKTGKKVGSTPKLSKWGNKAEVLGMGFDPANAKLAVYFSADKGGRVQYLARFQVPGGEPVNEPEVVADPGDYTSVSFVNDDLFLAFERPADKRSRDANRVAHLCDAKGKAVAVCGFPNRIGMFGPAVIDRKVAFAYLGAKEKPWLGLAAIPVPGGSTPVAAASEPAAMQVATTPNGSGNLLDILGGGKEKVKEGTKKKTEPVKERVFERQEQWEFGPQGILKKGERQLEVKGK